MRLPAFAPSRLFPSLSRGVVGLGALGERLEQLLTRPSPMAPALSVEQRRLIEQIRDLAPTLREQQLARFNEEALQLYRDHLLFARAPRGPQARWERPGDTPAMLVREPEA